jgi:hypothetical protein
MGLRRCRQRGPRRMMASDRLPERLGNIDPQGKIVTDFQAIA